MSHQLTKLADLEANSRYRLLADGVDAELYVVQAGTMPLVILQGGHEENEDDVPTKLVQLIGYVKFVGDFLVGSEPGFLSENPENGQGNLYFLREIDNGSHEFVYLACSPTFTLVSQ